MASSLQQLTDFTLQPQMTIDPTVDVESASSEVLNFGCLFRAIYPKKGQFGPSGKRRTKGAVVYECLLCYPDQAWSTPNEITPYITPNANTVISLALQTIQYSNDHRT
jgi:hypothetical protein